MSPDATMTSWYLGNWASPWGSRIRQFISTLLLWPDIYLEYTTPWRKRKPLTQVQKDTPSSPEIQIYDTERSVNQIFASVRHVQECDQSAECGIVDRNDLISKHIHVAGRLVIVCQVCNSKFASSKYNTRRTSL